MTHPEDQAVSSLAGFIFQNFSIGKAVQLDSFEVREITCYQAGQHNL